jgi:hypothetical protein
MLMMTPSLRSSLKTKSDDQKEAAHKKRKSCTFDLPQDILNSVVELHEFYPAKGHEL